MRHVTLAVIFLFLFALGCGSNSPITPDDPLEPVLTAQLSIPDTIGTEWEGHESLYAEYVAKLRDNIPGSSMTTEEILYAMVIERKAQYEFDPDFIPDGTDMSSAVLTVYFPAHIVEDTHGFGGFDNQYSGCDLYVLFYWYVDSINQGGFPPPFDFVNFLVFIMESNGYDVINNPPDIEPCDDDKCGPNYQSPFGEFICMWDVYP